MSPDDLPSLHDATLLAISFDWKHRSCIAQFSGSNLIGSWQE